MNKILVALCCACALALAIQAQDATSGNKKHVQTVEQKAFRKEMLAKYDTNKDGKLSKEEKAKFSAEDKAKWDKLFPAHKKKDTETK